jgi:hypothetical protein
MNILCHFDIFLSRVAKIFPRIKPNNHTITKFNQANVVQIRKTQMKNFIINTVDIRYKFKELIRRSGQSILRSIIAFYISLKTITLFALSSTTIALLMFHKTNKK